jgi:hypothetical protein
VFVDRDVCWAGREVVRHNYSFLSASAGWGGGESLQCFTFAKPTNHGDSDNVLSLETKCDGAMGLAFITGEAVFFKARRPDDEGLMSFRASDVVGFLRLTDWE